MQFERAYSLATDTPAAVLSVAWNIAEESALRCARQERPMTVREAGALADLHGMKLLDILAI